MPPVPTIPGPGVTAGGAAAVGARRRRARTGGGRGGGAAWITPDVLTGRAWVNQGRGGVTGAAMGRSSDGTSLRATGGPWAAALGAAAMGRACGQRGGHGLLRPYSEPTASVVRGLYPGDGG
ncbi:hypothetical protein A9Q02_20995 [Candidatus Chloroploca asiatica]|uniref:Uncharacterized protein n=2 Tax=Candidatus Chloroploca asiatica TaxID=1506545 RepID=A0A2H3LEZ1_9CHLR|nr:hypothetical protein A9Q02_20995 [Candidatus Chloroploca asiatica]